MKTCSLAVVLVGLVSASVAAQESCLVPAALVRLDRTWETALLESDAEPLATMLADDFIWIHNHVSSVDTRASLLERVSRRTRSRVSSDVEVRVLGSTAVVTGYTVVDRGPRPTKYHFMRTYVEVSGRCLLLANHTMAIPEEDG